MSTFPADMSIIHNAISKIGVQMESAIPAVGLSDETGNNLPLDFAVAADSEYEVDQISTESNFVVNNLTKAMDWLEDLIRRLWAYVRKGIHLFQGYIKKWLGHASWLKRVLVKYVAAFETLERKKVGGKTCVWQAREHPINLMSGAGKSNSASKNGFDQANFPQECRRLVDLASYLKGDYFDSASKFATGMEASFSKAILLTPDEVVGWMNTSLAQFAKAENVHPAAPLFQDGVCEPVKGGTNYDSRAYLRSTDPYLGGHVWTLSYPDNNEGGKTDKNIASDAVTQLINSVVRFGPDHAVLSKTARINFGDKVEFTNDPTWIKESSRSLLTAMELIIEMYTDTRAIDIEAVAKRMQNSIDRYFSAIRSNPDYASTAGAHIEYIKMGSKFLPNIMQPLQGIPAAIIRVGSSFVSLVDAALDSYETA